MSDATGHSVDFVTNQFLTDKQANERLAPARFFQLNPTINKDQFAVAVVIADIQFCLRNRQSIDLESYFVQIRQLKSHADAWKVLEAADPWMVENEGPEWIQAWVSRLENGKTQLKRLGNSSTKRNSVATDQQLADVEPGTLKRGARILDFEIMDSIGKGTFGDVYLARNLKLGREVALKITTEMGNEGLALARLNHENIVRVFGEHSLGSRRLLEMQYVEGCSLDRWIENNSNLCRAGSDRPETERQSTGGPRPNISGNSNNVIPAPGKSPTQLAVWIVSKLAGALQHAHERGILHLDIKPANIMIDLSGEPLLMDFNVALISGQDEKKSIGGTINYMSPEQLRAYCLGDAASLGALNVKSDLYSLGIVLLELLGGQKIWGNVSRHDLSDVMARQLLAARQMSAPERIRSLPGVNHSLAAIIKKVLQPNSVDRYRSASELETDLTRWLDGKSNAYAANPDLGERSLRLVRRHRVLVATSACLLLALGGALFGWIRWEANRLRECDELLSASIQAIDQRQGAVAAEGLGNARAILNHLWMSSLVDAPEFQRLSALANRCSSRIRKLELFRFSSLFGQASLLQIHQRESGHKTGNGNDLVRESLDSYRVTSDPQWQQKPPFVQLPQELQDQVAENITELMLVSMITSSQKQPPTPEQWEQVCERLPRQHQSLQIFRLLRPGVSIPVPADVPLSETDGFESYLFGVWATCRNETDEALQWYENAISVRLTGDRERFWLRYRLGLTCQRLGKHQQALVHYAVCLGMRPDFAWIPFNMSLVYLNLEQTKRATDCLERAIVLDPMLTAAYQALVPIYTESGNFQSVVQTLDRAIAAGAASAEMIRQREQANSRLQLDQLNSPVGERSKN